MNNQPSKAHTLPSRTSRHTSQNLAKSVLLPTQEEIQFFFSLPSEKIKTPDTQTNLTKTVKLNKDNGLQTRWTKTPAGNSSNCCTTLPKPSILKYREKTIFISCFTKKLYFLNLHF